MLRDVIRREQLRADEVNGKVRKQHQVADAQERLLQRLSQPAHLKPPLPATLPSTYFYDLASTFQQRMELYKDQIEEIEQFLSSSAGPSRAGIHDASSMYCCSSLPFTELTMISFMSLLCWLLSFSLSLSLLSLSLSLCILRFPSGARSFLLCPPSLGRGSTESE